MSYISGDNMAKKKSEIVFYENTEPKLNKFKISLPFLPEREIEAATDQEAIEKYDKMMGVRKTVHRYVITKV